MDHFFRKIIKFRKFSEFSKKNLTFFELWSKGPVDEEERFGGIFDGHEMTEDGFPKVAQIAYAKHILGFYKIILKIIWKVI